MRYVLPEQRQRLIFRAMLIRFIAFAVGITFSLPSDAATEPRRRPWEWTDAERLAARFDPITSRARFDQAVREGLVPNAQQYRDRNDTRPNADSHPNVIIGRHNPELFLPFELFTIFVTDTFAVKDEAARRQQQERLGSIANITSSDFWTKLESAVAAYASSIRRQTELAAKLRDDMSDAERRSLIVQLDDIQRPQCELRRTALAAAAEAVGQEILYKMLYEGVAPQVNMLANDAGPSRLAFVAGGCR